MLIFRELKITSQKHLIIDVKVSTSTEIDPHQIIALEHIYLGFCSNKAENLTDLMESTIMTVLEPIETASTDYQDVHYIRGLRYDIDLLNPTIRQIFGDKASPQALIYVKAKVDLNDVIIPSADCSKYAEIKEAYTYDKCITANMVFQYLHDAEDPCADLTNLANMIVRTRGIELALESGNFQMALSYWNKFFAKEGCCGSYSPNNNDCGCHH